MANRVAVMQPAYLGWMGYWSILDQADLFVLLDTVAINEQSWQTRNRVINSQGNETMLSIPTHTALGDVLHEIRIAENGKWRRKHHGTITAITKKEHLRMMDPLLAIYLRQHVFLTEFTREVLRELAFMLKIDTPIVFASGYGLPKRTDRILRLTDILEHTGATEFLEPMAGRPTLGVDVLPSGSDVIPIRYMEHTPYPYGQGKAKEFVPYMSVVDCLARHGAEFTRDVIHAG